MIWSDGSTKLGKPVTGGLLVAGSIVVFIFALFLMAAMIGPGLDEDPATTGDTAEVLFYPTWAASLGLLWAGLARLRNGAWRDERLQVYLAGIPAGVALFFVLGAIAWDAEAVVEGPVVVLGLLGWLTWLVAGGMALAGRLSLRSAVIMSLAPYAIAALIGLLALVL